MRLLLLCCLLGLRAGAFAAPAAAANGAQPPSAAAGTAPLRIWIDEYAFADGETALLREAAAATGGSAVVAGSTHNSIFQLKSYQLAGQVDVMWTGQKGCYEAFKRRLNATHTVSCVPGTQAVAGKAALIASLQAAYGEQAWGIVPRSFRLPHQYADLAAHLHQEQAAGRPGMWVLKEDVHRGRGVGVVTPAQALARALDPAPGGAPGFRHVLLQRFLAEQYLVGGRPFYIRLWAVLLGADPARAHLWDGGVVVFGQQQHAGQGADAMIVNLWTQDRAAAAPWSLQQLEQHLEAEMGGAEAPRLLRRRLHAMVSASLAAGLPAVRYAAGRLAGFQGGSFEVLGIDFLVDAGLRPWLVEVNQLPSMARKVVGSASTAAAAADSDDAGQPSSGDGSAEAGQPSSSSSGSGSAGAGQPSSNSSGSGTLAGDVPFDAQKERFVGALLQLLTERHRQHSGLQQQAERLLREASEAAGEEEPPPCVLAPQLQQLLAMQAEQAAAQRLGFVSLTAQFYRSLECMAAPHAGSSSSGSSACEVLADLVPPQAPQQCSAPSARTAAAVRRLQGWYAQLQLQAASLLPRLRHAVARRRPGGAAAAPPYTLRAADERMLAWMRRGSPPLTSLQALQAFCAAEA